MKILYSWLQQEYFDNKLPSIDEVVEALLFHSFEIEEVQKLDNDAVIDVDVLPNRAHDCLSHRGVAKELSLILGVPIVEKSLQVDFKNVETQLKIKVKEKKLCDRYIGRILRNIEIKESPDWLKNRLEALGQKSINTLVDATNYVLFDIGQPTHVFDLDKLSEEVIEVKRSIGEEFEALDGKKFELTENDLVIVSSSKLLAIAGVKGGKYAEVTNKTKNIILESAHFDPVSVRKTSRRLSLLTDSSKRFENEPTPQLAAEAMEYLTRLVVSLCGQEKTVVEYSVDENQNPEKLVKIDMQTEHVNKLLGTNLADQEVADILNRFGFDYQKTGDEFSIEIPSERLDLRSDADLVEEIGRIYGYQNIPSVELPPISNIKFSKEFYYTQKIKEVLIKNGFSEVYTESFRPKGKLLMANPVAKDRPYLRESIDLENSFNVNFRNKDLLGLDEIKIFEMGKVFDEKANEKLVLSLKSEKDLNKNLLDEFGIKISNKEVQINLEPVIEKLPEINSYLESEPRSVRKYREFSRYPFITRDIAVWVFGEDSGDDLVKILKEQTGDLLVREPRLVDEYTKDGNTSYAYRLVFQSYEKTLTDVEIGEIMKRVEKAIGDKGWQVR